MQNLTVTNLTKLKFEYLPGYAQFLLDNKLEDFVKSQLELSHEVKLPLLRLFESMPEEEFIIFSKKRNKAFLTNIIENRLDEYLEKTVKTWLLGRLPLVTRTRVAVDDITLVSYIRKKTLTQFIPEHTDNTYEVVALVNEIDRYILQSESAFLKTFFNIQLEHFKEAQSLAKVGNFAWDIEEKKITWSDEVYRIYGLKPQSEDITFERFTSFIHPEDREHIVQLVRELLQTHEPHETYYRIIANDDVTKFLHTKREVLLNEKGQPYKMIGTVQDVTERQELIERLLHSENLFKKTEELTHIGNWTWDVEKNKVSWSDELYRIYGLEPQSEEITFERFLSFIHPDDRVKRMKEIERSLETLKSPDYTIRIMLDDGSEKILHGKGEVLADKNGKAVKLMGTCQDVTMQRRLENELRENQNFIQKIADATPSMIAVYNVNTGLYAYINPTIEALLGYTQREMLKGGVDFILKLIHPDDVESLMKRNAAALESANAGPRGNSERVEKFLYRLRHKDGQYRWIRTYGTVFDRNDKGEVRHVLNVSLDVTKEYSLRKQLEQNERYNRSLISNAPDAIIVVDKKGKIVLWNPKAEEIFGWKAKETEGLLLTDTIIPPQYRKAHKEGLKKYFTTGKSPILNKTIEITALNKKGIEFDVSLTISKTVLGDQPSFIGFIRDISEKKKAESALRKNKEQLERLNKSLQQKNEEIKKSEERYHRMINEVKDYAIFRLGEDGTIESWNKGAETIKGYKAADVIGKNFRVFYRKEDRKKQLPEKLLAEAAKDGRVVHEGWRVHKDGSAMWSNVVITALRDENNNVIGFSKVTRDLTELKAADDKQKEYAKQLEQKNKELEEVNSELKKAQQQLAEDHTRFVVDVMPDIVITGTPEGDLNYSNQRLIDYTGFSFDELKGWGWGKAVHEEDLEGLTAAWMTSLQEGTPLNAEFRLKRADGEYFWHLVKALPYRDESRIITMWIATLTNIHDQKIKEERKDEFIALASHELKTPLTSALAYSQLVLNSLESKDYDQALEFSQQSTGFINRLNILISGLLDISRIQHGKFRLNITEFNFDAMLEETVENIQEQSGKHEIIKKGSVGKPVKGDNDALRQVCINLISNAIKYSPKAKRVGVKVSCDKDEATIAVTDYGIGIAKYDLEKVFNRFYRVEGKATQFQGLGIGLYISSEIIKEHNGRIWAESEPGKGSTFYFSIPVGYS